jgi:starch phosphorylase
VGAGIVARGGGGAPGVPFAGFLRHLWDNQFVARVIREVAVRKIHQYSVHPDIPPRLSGLVELALNLRWTWDSRAFKVFQHLDPELLEKCGDNPVLLLRRISRERLDAAAQDAAFLTHLDKALDDLRAYLSEPGWFRLHHPQESGLCVAYFCMEFGLTASLPIYSGGLGVLAGDHLKAASGLDLPLVAVGLFYNRGYFTQQLDDEGWQRESYRLQDIGTLPIRPVTIAEPGRDGASSAATTGSAHPGAAQPAADLLKVRVDMKGRPVWARVWVAQVGRIPLYLLDTAVPENDPAGQRITSELYGGGTEERLAQELILGIGGMRLLKALGLRPQTTHLNEGHAVFSSLERIRDLMVTEGLTYHEARQATGAGTLFTTHTPVPAGFDLFPKGLIESYLGEYLAELGLTTDDFMRMGRVNREDSDGELNVAVLALRQSPRRNAVSRLHRRVSARMMQPGWVDFPLTDIPIASVTNGVHTKTWVSAEMELLYDHYLGPRWREDASSPEAWQRVERIPDLELWRTHTRLRERLVAYAREQSELRTRQRLSDAALPSESRPLRPDALTIGFARRFATYKRATLLFRDPARLKAILLNETRPVQVLIAGKAHPRDGAGKDMIRHILDLVRNEGLSDRVVFLEDYDLRKTGMLVQGVDVWLNTPRRPNEASGTSGMKVVPNGGLNLSVLDGWWAEGYRKGVGWAIGDGQEYAHSDYQDELDAQALYTLLEREVVPLFYDRDVDGLPRGWIAMMKQSIRTLTPAFSGDRMVKEYVERFYLPAGKHYERLAADSFAKARELAAWKDKVRKAWCDVKVTWVEAEGASDLPVGTGVPVTAKVHLGALEPSEVLVQAYHSRLRPDGTLSNGHAVDLEWVGLEDGVHTYRGSVPSRSSGLHGFSVRVLPHHDDVLVPNELPLITWEEG